MAKADDERAERLAAALRDNLRKRKAQSRSVEPRNPDSPSEPRRTPD